MFWVLIAAFVGLAIVMVLSWRSDQRQIAGLAVALEDHGAQLAQQQKDLESLRTQLGVATSRLGESAEQLKISREEYDAAVKQQALLLGQLRLQADAHFLAANADAVQAARLVTELEQYAIRTLEDEAAAGPRARILRGGLYARQLSVLDVVPELAAGFLAALQASTMYRQEDGPHGARFYLRWPATASAPDLVLAALLTAATHPPAGQEDPGTAQLRAVLHALHDGGPAVLHLGPLVLARTRDRMLAGIAPAGWRGLDDLQKTAAVEGIGPNLLSQIGAAHVTDLTGWSDQQTA